MVVVVVVVAVAVGVRAVNGAPRIVVVAVLLVLLVAEAGNERIIPNLATGTTPSYLPTGGWTPVELESVRVQVLVRVLVLVLMVLVLVVDPCCRRRRRRHGDEGMRQYGVLSVGRDGLVVGDESLPCNHRGGRPRTDDTPGVLRAAGRRH
jgi:hypothetical protein